MPTSKQRGARTEFAGRLSFSHGETMDSVGTRVTRKHENMVMGGRIIEAKNGNSETSNGSQGDYELRLMALVQHMVRRRGRMDTAAKLGIDSRTLASSLSQGRLTDRVRRAAEMMLFSDINPAVIDLTERAKTMERRIETLEGTVSAIGPGVDERLEALTKDFSEKLDAFGTRQSQRETGGPDGPPMLGGGPTRSVHGRKHLDLVASEPVPEDKEVFRTALPLIEEWRKLTKEHPEEGKSLSWLMAEERRLVLEIDLMEIHGLTLPPETRPLRDILLRKYRVSDRKYALSDVRFRRIERQALRWVRRILTLGRWWN